MKKILVLTNIYPAPDMEKENTPIVHYFTKEWVKMGYNVRVVHYPANFPKIVMWGASLFKTYLSSKNGAVIRTKQATETEFELDGVKVKRIPLLKYKPHAAYSKSAINKAYMKTLDFCKKDGFEPDAIISHWVNPQLEIMQKLKAFYNVPTCYVAHLGHIELTRIYSNERIQDLISSMDIVGFRSAFIKQQFVERFGYNGPSFQCYSGIPEQYVSNNLQPRQFDKVNSFIFVGTLIERKYPAEIVPAVAKAYDNEDFVIRYVGKGAETEKALKYACDLLVEDKVQMLGYLKRDEVVEQLKQTDVFVMISRSEAFGLVYLEAMAVGCITIASRKEGFDGIIEHGVNGFLCEAGNVEELSQLISVIKSMPKEKLQEISQNAIKTARELTDVKAAKMYIEAVESVTKS